MATPAEALDDKTNRNWVLVDEYTEKRATQLRQRLTDEILPEKFDKCINHIIKYYLYGRLKDSKNISEVIYLFKISQHTKDARHMLKAYTVEADYYRTLNEDLAGDHFYQRNDENYQIAITYILVFLLNDFQVNKLRYRGNCYRGLLMTRNDFQQYKKGRKVLFTAFQSTSRLIASTKKFSKSKPETPDKKSALFIFSIKYSPTAIALGKWSKFPNEEEVLIFPYSLFEIKESYEDSNQFYIVEFEECKTEMPMD